MKYLSCLAVLSLVFLLPLASSAEYYPIPYQTEPITETPLDGTICRIACRLYGDSGVGSCLTPDEQSDIDDNPDCWISYEGDPCKKCSSKEYRLTEVNGVETCLHDPPCPVHPVLGPYTYGNYYGTNYGTDACYLCPENYDLRSGECHWVGLGPAPPEPVPDTSAFLRATDGESTSKITVTWGEVEGVHHYYLERLTLGNETSEGWVGLGWRGVPYYDDGPDSPDTENELVPDTEIGQLYSYRVKACNSENVCSDYSTEDKGYRSLEKPVIIMGKLEEEKLHIKWNPVEGAMWYEIYIADDQKHKSFQNMKGFKYHSKTDANDLDDKDTQFLSDRPKHAIAVQACTQRTEVVCSGFTIFNLYKPLGAFINNLLLQSEER